MSCAWDQVICLIPLFCKNDLKSALVKQVPLLVTIDSGRIGQNSVINPQLQSEKRVKNKAGLYQQYRYTILLLSKYTIFFLLRSYCLGH